MKLKKFAVLISLCSAMILPVFSVNAAEGLPTKAYICGDIGAVSVGSADEATEGSVVAEVNGDAQYEAEWKISDIGTNSLTFLALSIPNITSDSYSDIDVKITAVYIDGVKTNYTMSANALNTAYYEAGKNPETRVYIYDEVKGTNVADLPKLTTIQDSIKVVFTVTGTGVTGVSNIKENIIETQATTDTQSTTTTTSYQGGRVEGNAFGKSSPVNSSTTGDAGIAAAAIAGLAVTAGAAILSKVKLKKKK